MITWPVALPQIPIANGFSRSTGDNVLVSPSDLDRGARRRRYSSRNDILNVVFYLNRDELDVFESFYSIDLADGSKSFSILDPLKQTPITVVIDGPVRIDAIAGSEVLSVSFQLKVYV